MMTGSFSDMDNVRDILKTAVERMSDAGAEFADARSQSVRVMGASSVNGNLRQLVEKGTGGVCLRAWSGGRWGYGTVTSFDKDSIMAAADMAVRNASGDGRSGFTLEPVTVRADVRADVRIHPDSVDPSEKVAAVLDIDKSQSIDDRIINSMGSYSEEIKDNALVNSIGSDIRWEEVRTLCRAMSAPRAMGFWK